MGLSRDFFYRVVRAYLVPKAIAVCFLKRSNVKVKRSRVETYIKKKILHGSQKGTSCADL